MIIIGTFKHSIELEYALTKLESIGIAKERLLIVCMDHTAKELQSDQQKKKTPIPRESRLVWQAQRHYPLLAQA